MMLGALLFLLQVAPANTGAVPLRGPVAEEVNRLRAGEYIWAPQVSPAGPTLMVVNVQTQRAIIYRNGVPIGISTVSTGRKGHDTPTGIYVVLQKQVEHYSSLYDAAPMPFMQRLTWDGVALHGGHLPGYPASHGCIRLPHGFAKLLYGATRLGMTVVVTRMASMPPMGLTQAELLGGTAEQLAFSWHPERVPTGPVSILISGADRQARVIRNGREIGVADVQVNVPIGSPTAYMRQADGSWLRLGLDQGELPPESPTAPDAIVSHPEFRARVLELAVPGTVVVLTPDPLRPELANTDALLGDLRQKKR